MIMIKMKKKKILLYLEPSTLIITRLYLLFVNSKYEFLWGGGKGEGGSGTPTSTSPSIMLNHSMVRYVIR